MRSGNVVVKSLDGRSLAILTKSSLNVVMGEL